MVFQLIVEDHLFYYPIARNEVNSMYDNDGLLLIILDDDLFFVEREEVNQDGMGAVQSESDGAGRD